MGGGEMERVNPVGFPKGATGTIEGPGHFSPPAYSKLHRWKDPLEQKP